MGRRSSQIKFGPGWIREPRFWDGVEQEIEALDWLDLEEFLEADALPYEPRPGFFEELRDRLRGLVRARYQT